MIEQIVADLQRRLANVVRRGVIHSVQHGDIPRCRVAIGDIVTDWLPLCQGFSGENRRDVNPGAAGDAVTVLSEAGELRNGRVYPGCATGDLPVPSGHEGEHITVYGDGTEVRYDRRAHAMTITLVAGGTYRLTGEGTLDGNVTVTKMLTVGGDVKCAAEVADHAGSMSQIRETFNKHTHGGDSGGTTGKPNQNM